MFKALKAGFFGLALGALGAVALPTQEAEAQGPITPHPICCSNCNPNYQNCVNSAGNNPAIIAQCVQVRIACESSCRRTC